MTFPVIEASAESAVTSAGTSHTVSLPTGIVSGDLLIVYFSGASHNPTVTFPAGWTELFDGFMTNEMSHALAYRKADGTEGASITVTSTNPELSAHVAYRISGAEDPATQAPEQARAEDAIGSTTPNPPSFSPTGGAKDYLWLVLGASGNGTRTVSAFPTNYTVNQQDINSGGAGGGHAFGAGRQLNAATEDPATFTISASTPWFAVTVAVHPTSAFPSAPDNLTATPVSETQVDLAWDAVAGADFYDIERDAAIIVKDHATTTYSDTGLSPNTQYSYRVRAVKNG